MDDREPLPRARHAAPPHRARPPGTGRGLPARRRAACRDAAYARSPLRGPAIAVVALFGLLIVTAAVQTSRDAATTERGRARSWSSRSTAGATRSVASEQTISSLRAENARLGSSLDDLAGDERSASNRRRRAGRDHRLPPGHRGRRPDHGRRLRGRQQGRAGARRRPRHPGRRHVGGRCRGDLRQRLPAHQRLADPQRQQGDPHQVAADQGAVHRAGHRRPGQAPGAVRGELRGPRVVQPAGQLRHPVLDEERRQPLAPAAAPPPSSVRPNRRPGDQTRR